MPNQNYKIIIPILCILWICMIFYMSSDVNSYDKTMRVSEIVTGEVDSTGAGIEDGLNNEELSEVDVVNLLIRKSGHFLEYLILCLLLLKTSEVYGIKLKQSAGYVLLICLLIANLDEFYQSFVPGRNSLVIDCLIDLLGALVGVFIYIGIGEIRLRKGKS